MYMPPVIGCDFARIVARLFDGVDQFKGLANLRPASNRQQDFAARVDLRHCVPKVPNDEASRMPAFTATDRPGTEAHRYAPAPRTLPS